jgi:hypothetical protein
MANPFQVNVPNAFEALMAGEQSYKSANEARMQRARDAARAEAEQAILQGGDMRSAMARLIGGGEFQGANAIANFGNQVADQQYKSGMLDIARQNSNRREEPEPVRTLRAAGVEPTSPRGQRLLFPKTDTPISATDKKAIFTAEDDVPRLNNTIKNIERAKELNSKIFTGYGASLRGSLGTSGIPGINKVVDKDAATATGEWDQLMGQEAIQMMAETLKGASTDFEMRKYIGIAADTTKPPEVRERAMDRFLDLAKAELSLRERRVQGLKRGDYFKPEGAAAQPTTQTAPRATAPARGEVRDGYRFKGGDPADPSNWFKMQ